MNKKILSTLCFVWLAACGYTQYKLAYSDTLMYLGKMAYQERDYINARTRLDSCIFLNPKNDECKYYRAKIEYDLKNYELAKIMFKNVLALAERDPSSWHMLGLSFMNLKQYDSAEFCFRNAVNINSRESKYYANWGQNQYLRGNYKHAEQLYSTAILLNDKQPLYYQNRADAREKLGDKTAATEDLTQALTLDPNNADIQSKQNALTSNSKNWIWYVLGGFIVLLGVLFGWKKIKS